MARILIVGDGPGGLSAALFLAKNGQEVNVFGLDKTALHFAYLYNYLGIEEIAGSDLAATARRQVERFGGRILAEQVTGVAVSGSLCTVVTASGSYQGGYLILTEGKNPVLARSLGLTEDDAGAVTVDRDQRSSIDRVYALGRSVRPTRSQAIISAGAGAIAALDILARETGKDVQDWDTAPES